MNHNTLPLFYHCEGDIVDSIVALVPCCKQWRKPNCHYLQYWSIKWNRQENKEIVFILVKLFLLCASPYCNTALHCSSIPHWICWVGRTTLSIPLSSEGWLCVNWMPLLSKLHTSPPFFYRSWKIFLANVHQFGRPLF